MRKLKQAFSLALALALSLAVAVPAFAAESTWKVEVPGKSDAEVFVGEKTFTVRDWVISGTYEDDEYGASGSIWTRTDSHKYTAENLCVLSRGDEVVFTKGGESFEELYMTAWSDPDGDGVYDQRIADLYAGVSDPFFPEMFIPINTTGPIRSLDARNRMLFYMPGPFHFEMSGLTPDGYGYWDAIGTDGISAVTELKMRPDFLLNIYGANTIVNFTTHDGEQVCTILVEGNVTQPTEPTTPVEPEQPTEPTTPVDPEQPVTPDEPGTYTVKKGDTWSSICTNFYGTNSQRYELMKANKGVALKEGVVITLPEKLGKDTLLPAAVAGEGEKLYTVKLGDTLGKIAAAEYGKASEYKAIFERNADRLKNANTIYEGQVIVLPARK